MQGGADVNAVDVRGLTALHGAALLGFDDVIRTLAAQNARLDVKDKRGITPLDMALGKGGGLGRGGAGATAHQSTADLLKQLLANNAQGGATAARRRTPAPLRPIHARAVVCTARSTIHSILITTQNAAKNFVWYGICPYECSTGCWY